MALKAVFNLFIKDTTPGNTSLYLWQGSATQDPCAITGSQIDIASTSVFQLDQLQPGGIYCDNSTGESRVVALRVTLPPNARPQSLPEEVEILTELRLLSAEVASFNATILTNLTKLQVLSIQEGASGGSNTSQLSSPDFDFGMLPASLVRLSLAGSIIHGDVSGLFHQPLPNLTELRLVDTLLRGPLTSLNFTHMPSLADLTLNNNPALLDGQPIPTTFFTPLQYVTSINLTGSASSPPIPLLANTFHDLPRLAFLSAYSGIFAGPLPSPRAFSNVSALTTLILSSNNLTGELPVDYLDELPALVVVSADRNQFSGNLTGRFAHNPQITTLFLNNNLFSGSLHSMLTSLPRQANMTMNQLDLGLTQLTGPINRTSFSGLGVLGGLSLRGLDLTAGGALPNDTFSPLKFITTLVLDGAKIVPPLPSSLATLPNVISVYLPADLATLDPDFPERVPGRTIDCGAKMPIQDTINNATVSYVRCNTTSPAFSFTPDSSH